MYFATGRCAGSRARTSRKNRLRGAEFLPVGRPTTQVPSSRTEQASATSGASGADRIRTPSDAAAGLQDGQQPLAANIAAKPCPPEVNVVFRRKCTFECRPQRANSTPASAAKISPGLGVLDPAEASRPSETPPTNHHRSRTWSSAAFCAPQTVIIGARRSQLLARAAKYGRPTKLTTQDRDAHDRAMPGLLRFRPLNAMKP